jgi:hypothetical protein
VRRLTRPSERTVRCSGRGTRGFYGAIVTAQEATMPVARRGFLASVAAVPLAPAALASQSAPAPAPAAVGTEAVAEALAEAVKRQFGTHLDAGELAAVQKELVQALERGERLHKDARLGNADAPVSLFEARPPQRRGGSR